MYSLSCCNSGVNEKLHDSASVDCLGLLPHLQCTSCSAVIAPNSNLWFLLQARGLSAQPGAEGTVRDADPEKENVLLARFTP